ncbi:hypothetical protein CHCC20331_3246 [Bacillus paralicheniformis]|nr:hypothetical protein CHCC20331_3246 [Bacillus paralicheniformis]
MLSTLFQVDKLISGALMFLGRFIVLVNRKFSPIRKRIDE